jgi:hypothetical protein
MENQKSFIKKILPVVLLLLTTFSLFGQKVVRYDLYVKDTIVNFTGKEKRAIAVNGQIPMPTLTFLPKVTRQKFMYTINSKKVHHCIGTVCICPTKKMVCPF